MSPLLAYPRLGNVEALTLLHKVREQAERDPGGLGDLVAYSHPRAAPVPTGAKQASEGDVERAREEVMSTLEPWMTGRPVSRDSTVAFDLALGRGLHRALSILPADAAHEETWSFLSLVVFPDVVWTRFPDLHPNRALGKRHRNTLRRAWFRYDVVGDLQEGAVQPLGEDEMTGIFERSQVARDRDLVRTVTQMILETDVRNRSEFVRNLMKGVTALTGTYLLDGLSSEELRERLASLTEEPRVKRRATQAAGGREASGRHAESVGGALSIERVTGHDRSDLVRRFHIETLKLCQQVEAVLGRSPTVLLRMIGQMGGVEAARSVVGSSRPSETFGLLWGAGRLDLTLEALVLHPEFRGLFSDALQRRAAERLSQVGFEIEL